MEFLVQVRKGELAKMGYVPTGLNGGTFLGRLVLAEPTARYGERRMILIYLVFMLASQLVFWQVHNIAANTAAITIFGFFSGPLFATVGTHGLDAGVVSNEN